MKTMVLLGAPGAGKGTQAVRIADALHIPHISTGAIFRQNIAEGTPLGKEADSYISAGNLVPDTLTNELVADRLSQSDCQDGFILDGFPRTTDQADKLMDILKDLGYELDAVINIDIPESLIVSRLLKRAEEEGRADDTREVIEHRIAVYHKQTAPLLNYYRERDMLIDVDGTGSIDEVWHRLEELFSSQS